LNKRLKELRRLEHRKEKDAKKQRKADEPKAPRVEGGEDPDIAHIVPGPQPIPDYEEPSAGSGRGTPA